MQSGSLDAVRFATRVANRPLPNNTHTNTLSGDRQPSNGAQQWSREKSALATEGRRGTSAWQRYHLRSILLPAVIDDYENSIKSGDADNRKHITRIVRLVIEGLSGSEKEYRAHQPLVRGAEEILHLLGESDAAPKVLRTIRHTMANETRGTSEFYRSRVPRKIINNIFSSIESELTNIPGDDLACVEKAVGIFADRMGSHRPSRSDE